TAIVVPAAVYAWGDRTTFLLLWMAWLAGGCCSYVIGRSVGRGLMTWMIDKERVDYFSKRISSNADFFTILLFQLALPSEIPGYVLGAVRYPFRTYFFVLALAELPFALGAVYLGDSFAHGQYVTFIAVAAVGLMFTAFAVRRFQRHLNRQENPVAPADAAKPESK
ncbi:MAG: TVP38/TMEM64 family protein, partial [Thermoanaerobaculia bacterium]